jgi:hypothetical protein
MAGLVAEDSPLWSGWSLSLYPEAGEAGASFVRPPSGGGPRRSDRERSKVEAARRARSKVRRYCAANRLNRLGTLTYAGAGCHHGRDFRGHIGEFFRNLRGELGGEAFAYVWTAEWHKSGHGLHAHFAVGRYIARSRIEAAWGRGFVHIKLLGDLPVGSSAWDEARLAARYLSKYVGKDFDAKRAAGLHRYDVAQGFQPRKVRIRGRSVDVVLAGAAQQMGRRPAQLHRSEDIEGYDGPPWVWASWR